MIPRHLHPRRSGRRYSVISPPKQISAETKWKNLYEKEKVKVANLTKFGIISTKKLEKLERENEELGMKNQKLEISVVELKDEVKSLEKSKDYMDSSIYDIKQEKTDIEWKVSRMEKELNTLRNMKKDHERILKNNKTLRRRNKELELLFETRSKNRSHRHSSPTLNFERKNDENEKFNDQPKSFNAKRKKSPFNFPKSFTDNVKRNPPRRVKANSFVNVMPPKKFGAIQRIRNRSNSMERRLSTVNNNFMKVVNEKEKMQVKHRIKIGELKNETREILKKYKKQKRMTKKIKKMSASFLVCVKEMKKGCVEIRSNLVKIMNDVNGKLKEGIEGVEKINKLSIGSEMSYAKLQMKVINDLGLLDLYNTNRDYYINPIKEGYVNVKGKGKVYIVCNLKEKVLLFYKTNHKNILQKAISTTKINFKSLKDCQFYINKDTIITTQNKQEKNEWISFLETKEKHKL